MKKLISIFLASLMLLTVFGAISASAASILFENPHTENNLINPIANVQKIGGANLLEDIKTAKASVAYINADDITDFAEVLKACKTAKTVPTIKINTEAQAKDFLAAAKSTNIRDITVTSSDPALLNKIRTDNLFIRAGLIVDLNKKELTSKEAHEIRVSVRSAPASFCIVKAANATKQAVAELQVLAVAVWVEIDATPNTDEFTIQAAKAITSGANGIISADANLVTKIINENFAENTMTRTPVLIGHRGNPTQAPENSLLGFITAYENGADIFEIDVEITADNEIIILHDNTLNRTTDYTGNKTVGQMRLSEIKKYKLKDKAGKLTEETVPTLKEVLEEFKDKDCRIFVEFKGSNVQNVIRTATIIKEYNMEDRVDVISFSTKLLTQTHESMPGMSTGCLASYNYGSKTYAEAVESLMRPLTDAQKNLSSINPGAGIFTVHFEQAATDRGITVWPWTYVQNSNNTAFMNACDGLTTDDVQWAKDMTKYLHNPSGDFSLSENASVVLSIDAVTYGGEAIPVPEEDQIIQVLTGKDCVKVEDGQLIGVSEGTATVIYGYKARTNISGNEYILYTDPVTVTVTPDTSAGSNATLYIIIGVAAVVIIAAVAVILIKRKKK